MAGDAPGSDKGIVRREYASEERFLARRLTAMAELDGPLVEDAMIAAIAEVAPRRVLDVGCGTGDLTARVRDETGAAVTGLDISPRMVELTAARGIPARVGEVEALPFADSEFDCVLANRVLYHVPDLAKGLAEISRVLSPGGRLVAVTYSDHHLIEVWERFPPGAQPRVAFSAENGGALLSETFTDVDRRDLTGRATFGSHDALRNYFESYGEFSTFSAADVEAFLRTAPEPFEATYRHTVFVAAG